jgi:hypothetical protein
MTAATGTAMAPSRRASPRGAEQHPGEPAGGGQEQGLGEELHADVASGGAEGAAQADLGAAFQHRDDHDVGDADPADEQRHGAE